MATSQVEEFSIHLFLKEATRELLFNIVYRHKQEGFDEIGYQELSDKFEKKVGYQPMAFFDLGNIINECWFGFLNSSPGFLSNWQNISTYEEDEVVYGSYNCSFLSNTPPLTSTVAEYRETLLIQACKLIAEDGTAKVNNQDEASGNTALHLVAAMPGDADDELILFKCLLQAGADPLQENKEGLNILHIIAGRMKALELDPFSDQLSFGSERIESSTWDIGHRQSLLKILSENVSQTHLAMMMGRPGQDGNTVMHEWVSSASDVQLLEAPAENLQDINIALKLLSFSGNVKIPNRLGLVPLHYAYNSNVFKFLLEQGAVCRSRNEQDETPFLFILKYLTCLAFVNISGTEEIKKILGKNIKETKGPGFVKEAVLILEHLITSLGASEELRKTVWIPDIEDVSPLEVVLVCVRVASKPHVTPNKFKRLRTCLVELLHGMLRVSRGHLNRPNKNGQGPLHVLLDFGPNNSYSIINNTELIQCLQALLKNGADVNAVDSKGKTALDIVKHSGKSPFLRTACVKILRDNGAQDRSKVANEDNIATMQQHLSNISISPASNVKRKLRGTCPQRHTNTANQLMDARMPAVVTVVQKYRYFSQRSIGSGGFSSIYVATKDEHEDGRSHTIDCRAVALKRLEKAKINPQEIKREVQTLLSVSSGCENILNCYESFEDEFFHYLCLDLMDGDLQLFIEESSMNELMRRNSATPVHATREIANGLTYLHEKNFLHRDLKPGNILYTIHPTLHFKIGDFGLAKSVSSSSTMTSTRGGGVAMAPGTRCWMAPELVSLQSREHTKESDVFALGLVLHFLLSFGKHPFVGATEEPPHVIEKNIVDMKTTIDISLSSEASHFIQTILAKKPAQRTPAAYLKQHPFLWSEKKKIEFLKAVGDQPEAVKPIDYPNSCLEQCLQKTSIGRQVTYLPWENQVQELFNETTIAWRPKKYRTNNVIDLLRFLRNSYAHKEERSLNVKHQLDNNIFLKKFPSLVLDVFVAVQNAGMVDELERSNIFQALSMS